MKHIRRTAMDPEQLTEVLISKYAGTLRYFRGEFWHYQNGVYVTIPNDLMIAEISNMAQREADRAALSATPKKRGQLVAPVQSVTRNIVADAHARLKARTIVAGEKMPLWLGADTHRGELICVKDGLMDVDVPFAQLQIVPHTPDWFNAIQLPFEGSFEQFDDEEVLKPCPRWKDFLNDVLDKDQDRVRVLQEFFGYALTTSTAYQKFLVLLGSGSNGKSVVLNILQDLVGEKNVSAVPLDLLFERFQAARTINKLLNVVSETEDRKKISIGQLKSFVSGDRMHADRKGINGVDFIPTARIVIATNKFPELSDESNGLWRRALVIPFNKTIEDDRKDPHLTAKLRIELPGILHWALRGLDRLRQQNHFTASDVCEAALHRHRTQRDPVGVFLREHFEPGGAYARVVCQDLRDRFITWTKTIDDNVVDPDSVNLRRVQMVFPKVERMQKRIDGRPIWHYIGIRPKPSDVIH